MTITTQQLINILDENCKAWPEFGTPNVKQTAAGLYLIDGHYDLGAVVRALNQLINQEAGVTPTTAESPLEGIAYKLNPEPLNDVIEDIVIKEGKKESKKGKLLAQLYILESKLKEMEKQLDKTTQGLSANQRGITKLKQQLGHGG